MFRYKSKSKKVCVLSIRIVKSNVSSVGPSSERNIPYILLSDEGPTLLLLLPTFLYFDLYDEVIPVTLTISATMIFYRENSGRTNL